MVSSVITHLPITSIPPSATKSRGFNNLAPGSLFSVGKSCNHNCTAVFEKNSVKILKSTEVNKCSLSTHNSWSPQWTITTSLFSVTSNSPTINKKIKCNHKCLINLIPHCFYHGASFYPTNSTWFKAIKNGFLQNWTELTVNQVTKYTLTYEATVKGHIYAHR